MIEFENKKNGNGGKIVSVNREARVVWEALNREARSQNRNQFTQIKLVDPRIARQELPLKQAKDRRQKLIQENRSDRLEENKKVKEKPELNDPKQLSKMIKELTQALNNYISITTQEIDNIKRIVEVNNKTTANYNQKQKDVIRDMENRIQNIINKQKEMWMKHEALESLAVGMIESSQNKQANNNYLDSKHTVREKTKDYKIGKQGINQNPYKRGPPRDAIKSILFDRYKWNKGRVVVKTNDKLKVYQVSISSKSGSMYIYIKINNQWRRYREFFKNNKNTGIIFGKYNIIKALRENYQKKNASPNVNDESLKDNMNID